MEGQRDLLLDQFEEDVVEIAESEYLRRRRVVQPGNIDIHHDNQHKESISLHEKEDDDDTFVMFAEGRMFRLQKEDLEPAEEDPEEYFHQIYDDFKRRQRRTSQIIHDENYEDVHYWPYEWMLHVGTEYYYRYEGKSGFYCGVAHSLEDF